MGNRRQFLKHLGVTAVAAPTVATFFNPSHAEVIANATNKISHRSPLDVAADENYWLTIRDAFSISPTIINLNNGGVSPQPILTQDMQDKYNRMSNEAPSYFMWRVLDMGREPLRERLANHLGASTEEIAINRNASEALETAIFGIDLQKDDEVILSHQDYPNMMNAWKLREKRHGIKLVWLTQELPQEDDDYFVKLFSDAVTEKTKVVHITHIINWMGQILPVKKIVAACKKKNSSLKFVLDGAHSFGHFNFKITDFDVDYFGTSLHKWMCAPFGTGMLWVKKENISSLWPLFANDKPDSDDIRKFEALGTRSFPTEQAIGYSLNFHDAIGIERKEARLRYLKNYWSNKVKDIPKVKLHTSLKDEYSCAIGSVSIDGIECTDVDSKFFSKYKIHTVGIKLENFNHVRVTPNVYTTIENLDKLISAITDIAANGVK